METFYFDLPLKVQEIIREYKGIKKLYDWQEMCLRHESIVQLLNLIYVLPTSSGKTLVAEILMMREVLCHELDVLFILPYISTVREKVISLEPFAANLNFSVEEYVGGKGACPPPKKNIPAKRTIYVATIEKGSALLDALIATNRSNEIGLVIVDELHFLGEVGRGGILETFLTKIMLISNDIQIIGMTATLGNIKEIATFLKAQMFTGDFRPVELKEYLKIGNDIFSIQPMSSENNNPTNNNAIEGRISHSRTVDVGNTRYYCEGERKEGKKTKDPDFLTTLVQETIPEESCLIFCPTKQNCEDVALLLSEMLSFSPSSYSLKMHQRDNKLKLIKTIVDDVGAICPILNKTIPYGVAYHHAGLMCEERQHLEEAYRMRILCVLCCTSTLANGINLPAKRVILRSPYVGQNFLRPNQYKQMIGRAGRPGQADVGESILICKPEDLERVMELLSSPMDVANSSLVVVNNNNGVGNEVNETYDLQSFILNMIGLGIAKTCDEVQRVVKHTLLSIQSTRLNVDIKCKVNNIIAHLTTFHPSNILKFEWEKKFPSLDKMIRDNNNNNNNNNHHHHQQSMHIPSIHPNNLNYFTRKNVGRGGCIFRGRQILRVTRHGEAAIRGYLTLERTNTLYADLKKAANEAHIVSQNHNHLQLLYISAPLDITTQVQPDPSAYFEAFNQLNVDEHKDALIIGITDANIKKFYQEKKLDLEITSKLRRFFIALVLHDLWNGKTIIQSHTKFKLRRGTVQSIMQNAATQINSILRFCDIFEEFNPLRRSFEVIMEKFESDEVKKEREMKEAEVDELDIEYNKNFI